MSVMLTSRRRATWQVRNSELFGNANVVPGKEDTPPLGDG